MIVTRGLCRSFGDVRAVDRVSFELPAGAAVAILGPSGCGKTTFLRLLAGLEVPDDGEVVLDGVTASRPGWVLGPHLRGMGVVFQEPALWPHLTVNQQVLFGLDGLRRDAALKRAEEVLEGVGVFALARRYPHQLSGGEARRVAVARALAPRPRRLLMDEPLGGLDEGTKASTLSFVKDAVTRSGASLVYVTHDEDEGKALADRVVLMSRGRFER